MDALTFHRIARKLYLLRIPILPKIIQGVIFLIFNSYIPYEAVIGQGTRIGHRGIGVVINRDAIIGKNALIRAHVTIGKKSSRYGAPVIGDNVEIGDGAKILGPIQIGDNVRIGANAVVLCNVPKGATVIGIPGRVVDSSQ